MKIGIVVPHIFMHPAVLPHVIFSPGHLALDLAHGLHDAGIDVTFFSPGKVSSKVPTITADLSYFDRELAGRNDSYVDLLKKHPFTFVTLARQVQSELITAAFAMANRGDLDIVHVYCNEEDIALPFAQLCSKPVVFTHHDPFNFLIKYKNVFPKYKNLHWLSISLAQRQGMPEDTNWLANIYHGLAKDSFAFNGHPHGGYVAYLGRIIEPKGVQIAIAAVLAYNQVHPNASLRLKIAGKHYSDATHDASYWQKKILPHIDGDIIQYAGFITDAAAKQDFLSNACALVIPSVFEEPFGMVMIEALACGTPIIGLNSGAIPEVIVNGETGVLVNKVMKRNSSRKGFTGDDVNEEATAQALAKAFERIPSLSRSACRANFEQRFTLDRMVDSHLQAYKTLL